MKESQDKLKVQIAKLPTTPGVYFFLGPKNKILYIGKATSLKSRVRSYFDQNIAEKRSPLIEKMVNEATGLKFEKTDSVLEALILESKLIKENQPPYNVADKDQKSFNFVIITDEKFPRVLVMRERELSKLFFAASLENHGNFLLKISSVRRRRSSRGFSREDGSNNLAIKHAFGPFPHGSELKEALKIVRKIFPFRDRCISFGFPSPASRRGVRGEVQGCFNYQIGLCPGTCVGVVTEKEYAKTIKHIKTFFEGNKKKLVKDLEKEMRESAKKREFEKASEIKKKIFALKHIQDVAMIRNTKQEIRDTSFRIEAYDIAHISGTHMVGVMTVIEDGEVKKSNYRMFKIRSQKGVDDTRALQEVLERRLGHKEWSLPNLIVADGGVAQLHTLSSILEAFRLQIPSVAVTKDSHHKPLKIMALDPKNEQFAKKYKREILLANSEAHRFAIAFHRKLRDSAIRSKMV